MFRRCLGCLTRYLSFPCHSPKEPNADRDADRDTESDPESKPMIPNPSIEWRNCTPFVPPITTGYVIKVYDGDTITIATKLPYPESPLYRFPVRLNGIDAPEIKGKTEDEKTAAKAAKHALENIILHRTVLLKNTQTEKYGRILADVYLEELHLNKWMLDNRYAVPYDGGTKKSPDSWLEFNSSLTTPIPATTPATTTHRRNHK